jgi:phage protein D
MADTTSPSRQTINGNYRAKIKLEIDGQSASEAVLEDILYVVVEESLNLPTMFIIALKNDYHPGSEADTKWKHQNLLEIGKLVKIGAIASTTDSSNANTSSSGESYLIEGEITAIETHFSEKSQAPIILRGYDVSHRLQRGRWNRSFQNVTDSDIVKKIAGEEGISVGTIEDAGLTYEYLFQENQSNLEFLRKRAERLGFELFVRDGKLNFQKPKKAESLTLKWLQDLHSFRVRVNSAEQVKEVEVRAWDYKEKKAIVAKAQQEKTITQTQYGKGSSTSSQFQKKPTNPIEIIVDRPVSSPKEADAIAQSICDELGGKFICADAKGEGNSKIRPGQVIQLTNMGKYDGEYYVTDTRHTYYERVYTTEFSIRSGGGHLQGILAPKIPLQPGQTLLIGIVTDNQDPDGLGRVKVKFPTLTEEHTSYWARVTGIGAGKDRGLHCLPEIDDEVVVGFEHGDIHRPFVLGGLWSGKDAPPAKVEDGVQDGKVRLRTLQTRTGHKLEFAEEDKGESKSGISIATAGGHQLQINDSEKVVEIATPGGNKLRLDDSSGTIELSSSGDLKIVSEGKIEMLAMGEIVLKGSLIRLN